MKISNCLKFGVSTLFIIASISSCDVPQKDVDKVENVFTTDMSKFLEFAGYRATIFKKPLPHRFVARS